FWSGRRHTRSKRDWSSDVCSSDLEIGWTPVAEQDRTRVLDAATGAAATQWYRPDIVERDIAEQRVAAQVESLKVARLRTHAHDEDRKSVVEGKGSQLRRGHVLLRV